MIDIRPVSEEIPSTFSSPLEKEVYTIFQKLHIPFQKVDSDAVYMMEECEDISKILGVEIRKSIFLRNQKGTSFFLVILPASKMLDLDELSRKIHVSNLSFATDEDMMRHLHLSAGSISASGILYDTDDYVQVLIDKEVTECPFFGMNTGVNTNHVKIATADFLNKFLPHTHHKAKVIDL